MQQDTSYLQNSFRQKYEDFSCMKVAAIIMLPNIVLDFNTTSNTTIFLLALSGSVFYGGCTLGQALLIKNRNDIEMPNQDNRVSIKEFVRNLPRFRYRA